MKTAEFDFHLPREYIALHPSERRDGSRLLVLHKDGAIEHRLFSDLPLYLHKGDMLLLNNTKVFPARIIGKTADGKAIDILLVKESAERGIWEILCRGEVHGSITIGDRLKAELWTEKGNGTGQDGNSGRYLKFIGLAPHEVYASLWEHGHMPLPPYIKRAPEDEDKKRYQTVYAEKQGSIAAPTAGLHFTPELLNEISAQGIAIRKLTLHVGPGTFKPIRVEALDAHRMDSEQFEFPSALIEEIRKVKEQGGRLTTVGTTTTRALEGFMSGKCTVNTSERDGVIQGTTDIFIYPGYTFKAVDSLVTNFHLPRSTPLMLASALCSFEKIARAYEEAIAKEYRFFSYGDAMLIV